MKQFGRTDNPTTVFRFINRPAEQHGRLRQDPALPNGIKYLLVSHNTRMGAARGAILVAEYLTKKGYIK